MAISCAWSVCLSAHIYIAYVIKRAELVNIAFIRFRLGFLLPQRYVLTLMGFIGVVVAYAMRLSLSVAITQMVPPPIMHANLSSSIDQPICPYNDDNYNDEHYDYQAMLDKLYSPVWKKFFLPPVFAKRRPVFILFKMIIWLLSYHVNERQWKR